MSAWLTGYDPEWSKLGPGIAALLEALDAAARAGCEIVDLGVGDQPYKDDFQDEDAAFPLESVTWCRHAWPPAPAEPSQRTRQGRNRRMTAMGPSGSA